MRPTWLRPTLSLATLNLSVALWLVLALNLPFWRALWQALGGFGAAPAGYLLTLPLFVLAWVWLILELLTWGRAARPVLALVLLCSAAAGYFIQAYGIVLDRGMLTNLVETDPAEATELLSWRLLGWMLLFGGLPLLLLWRVRTPASRWPRQLLTKGIVLAALAGAMLLLVAPFFQSYASLMRNHRDLRPQLVPTNFLAASLSLARARVTPAQAFEVVGGDARRGAGAAGQKPRLLLLVVGETARAANFSLNGYARPTNPELAEFAAQNPTELVSLRQVASCGTATAVSLPCMFLDPGRSGFEDGMAARRSSLLDVLQSAGVAVLWRDNNSGCKGVCDRVPSEDLSALKLPALCSSGECWDEVLLHGLKQRVAQLDRDTVVVLHMKGSHGPAYHLRVPPAFEHFKPVCRTNQLDQCAREDIVNAYDNTLRYTDHVLASSLALLKQNAARVDGALLYVSDHGESLGENGLYLHGLPYAMAPREQTHVPMLLWLSAAMRERGRIDTGCLQARRDEALSHDHLYHSVLRLMDVHTTLYRGELDLFAPCAGARPGVAPG